MKKIENCHEISYEAKIRLTRNYSLVSTSLILHFDDENKKHKMFQ
jgi:hypothetical protein